MDEKTCLKKAMTPPFPVVGAPSILGSLSLIARELMATVLPSAMLAITQRTLNWVLPRNGSSFGRWTYPER